MSDWRDLGPAAGFPEGEIVGAEVEVGERRLALAVVRTGDGVRVFPDQCPHRGAPFSELGILDGEGHLVCSWHYWSFRLADGQQTALPDVKLCAYPAREEGGRLLVDVEGRG